MPSVFVGLFMGLGASFAVLVVAEMMGVKAGLGWYLSWAQGWAAYPNMYAALLVMALMCSGLITLLFRLRDRLLSWQKGLAAVVATAVRAARHVRVAKLSHQFELHGQPLPVLDAIDLDRRTWRIRGTSRAQRLRQIHLASPDRRTGAPARRPHRHGRTGDRRA